MSDTPNIDDLRERIRKLDVLLTDPHPGLSTWGAAYAQAVDHLQEFFTSHTVPEVNMQKLIDAGLNAFGLQLFMESVALKDDAKTFQRFSFMFRNVKITLEPVGEVDTRHH